MRIITIVFFLALSSLFSQNFEGDTLHFLFGGNPTPRRLDPALPEFQQTGFLFGFHWSGERFFDSAFGMNLNVGGFLRAEENANRYAAGTHLIRMNQEISANDQSRGPMQSMAMQFDARLRIVPAISFNKLENDSLNSVFGFLNVRGRRDGNYQVFETDSAAYINTFVLSENWPAYCLQHTEYGDGHDIIIGDTLGLQNAKRSVNGEWWYLNINMGRLLDNDMTTGSQPVLRIKLKYSAIDNSNKRTYGYILFDSLPTANNYNIIDSRGRNRGKSSHLTGLVSDSIIITRNMLPTGTDRDVTFSARFRCMDTIQQISENHFLIKKSGADIEIDTMKIEVTYLGNNSTRVRWLRLETPQARNFFRGMYDDSIRHCIQADLTKFGESQFTSKNVRIFRFFVRDEYAICHWHTQKYMNKLLGGITAATHYKQMPMLGSYYIGDAQEWSDIKGYSNLIAAPYVRVGSDNPNSNTLGFKWGLWGHPFDEIGEVKYFGDTLISRYESSMKYAYPKDSIWKQILNSGFDYYHQKLKSSESTLSSIELFNYENYILHPGEEYTGKNFFSYAFIGSNWKLIGQPGSPGRILNKDHRPKTGEEIRFSLYNSLIRGCKGISFDRLQTNVAPEDVFSGLITAKYSELPLDTCIYAESVGSDYNDYYYYPDLLINYKKNLSAAFHRIDNPNRIYLGRRSARIELKIFSDYVRANESQIMNLHLAAWYGKGFRRWFNQDTAFFGEENIIKLFIDTTSFSIKTRPIGRVNQDNSPYYEQDTYVNHGGNMIRIDSGFFDITLLRESNHNLDSMKKVFYISVLNRRTDPLIYYDSTSWQPQRKHLRFLSSGEFADSCQNHPSWWNQWWWKRLGCREINIPFKLGDSVSYKLLRIRELGYDNATLNAQYWRQPQYYHKIDTVIGQDKELTVRLLPGEGKILKVEVIQAPPAFNGELTFSNQRKLIAYPINNNPDSLYYHLVYHRRDTLQKKPTVIWRWRVFYRRSNSVYKGSNEENIVWSNEICLSDSVYNNCDGTGDPYTDLDCAYPSVVVRKVGNPPNDTAYVYVVYDCANGGGYRDDNIAGQHSGIVECKFKSDFLIPSMVPSSGKTLKFATGSFYNNWGTPMLNASNLGNYYVWSDSTRGICTGYKTPANTCLADTTIIRFNNTNFTAKHPSVNSYSRFHKIGFTENECALVWQESYNNSPNQIYYTYLRYTAGNMNNYLYDSVALQNPGRIFNYNNSILKASIFPNRGDTYPVVYRGVEDEQADYNFYKFDYINWQSHNPELIDEYNCGQSIDYYYNSVLRNQYIKTFASAPNNNTMIYPQSSIYSNTGTLQNVDLSQGEFELNTTGQDTLKNKSNRALIMEFYNDKYCSSNELWHIPHNYLTFGTVMTDYNLGNQSFAKPLHSQGKNPKLAARPYIRSGEWWKNRRVYKSNETGITDKMSASAQHFYKGGYETVAVPFLGYADTSKSLMTLLKINDEPVDFDMYYLYPELKDTIQSNVRGGVFSDTIPTNWFTVPDNSKLEFMGFGMDTSKVKLVVERKRDNARVNVNLQRVADTTMDKLSYTLVNGGNQSYRLLLIKKNQSVSYTEHLILMPDPEETERFEKGGEENIVDLGVLDRAGEDFGMSIYPNPANSLIYVSTQLPENQSVSYKLFNYIGLPVATLTGQTGATISFDVSNLPQGVYFIRAETDLHSTVKSFVIEK